jgi:type IV secretory pathway VirD2 relaxase
VQRDGAPGQAYGEESDEIEGRSFIERCGNDRHQFRIIASVEDGDQYDDLKPLVRRFMAQLEQDLGTSLEWLAVDHVDTGHPHTHIIIRGVDDQGENLVISREYISSGMRARLSEIVTRDLGPQQQQEIHQRLRREVSAERLTSIDRALLKRAGTDRMVRPHDRNAFRHSVEVGRLKKLQSLGLAEPVGRGRWQLREGMTETLRRLGERGDIIRTMQRALNDAKLERGLADSVVQEGVPDHGIVGRVVARGLSDELTGRQYLVIDGTDGRVHHVNLGPASESAHLPQGSIVRVGIGGRKRSVQVALLSPVQLERLADHDGATWLDRELVSDHPEPLRDGGFGRDVRQAIAARRQWLLAQQLASGSGDEFRLEPGALAHLTRRDLSAAGSQLSRELGLDYNPAKTGERVEGMLRRRVDLASGRFALVETGKEFTLVPWRSDLERHLGKEVAGTVRESGMSWALGRSRGIEI